MLPAVLRVVVSVALLAILAACAAVVAPGSATPIASASSTPAPAPATNTPPAPATSTPTPAGGPSVTPQQPALSPTPGTGAPPAVAAARQALARQLGIPDAQVTLTTSSAVDWPDSCLGAARADEMCAQIITPGYRVIFATPQGSYELHTNADGSEVRIAPRSGLVPVAPAASPTSPAGGAIGGQVGPAEQPAVQAAQKALAAQLKLPPEQLQLQSIEAVEWSNSCLGAATSPREMCLQVITPGYRVIFSDPLGTHEVHTNRNGSSVRIVGVKP